MGQTAVASETGLFSAMFSVSLTVENFWEFSPSGAPITYKTKAFVLCLIPPLGTPDARYLSIFPCSVLLPALELFDAGGGNSREVSK